MPEAYAPGQYPKPNSSSREVYTAGMPPREALLLTCTRLQQVAPRLQKWCHQAKLHGAHDRNVDAEPKTFADGRRRHPSQPQPLQLQPHECCDFVCLETLPGPEAMQTNCCVATVGIVPSLRRGILVIVCPRSAMATVSWSGWHLGNNATMLSKMRSRGAVGPGRPLRASTST